MSNLNKTLPDYEIHQPTALVWLCIIIVALGLGSCALSGCATIFEKGIAELDRQAQKWAEKAKELPEVVTPEPDKPTDKESLTVDAIPFGSLQWRWGGFSGSGAKFDRVTLSGLSCNGKSVSYRFDVDLSAWGLSHGEAGAICAVFFERDGVFEGGKFDWVSSSRTSRGLKHVESYSNWPSSGIKLPFRGRVAFVIFSADGRRRSNVVIAEAK